MTPTTLANFHRPVCRPSTNKEARVSGLLPPEEQLQLAFDDTFFEPAPCIPDWLCTDRPQTEEPSNNRHSAQPQTGSRNMQPARTVPMIDLGHGTTSIESRRLTTEIWKLSGFPADRPKLAMGQPVILAYRSRIWQGVLKRIFVLEKHWVMIQVSLDESFGSTQNDSSPGKVVLLLYAPLCVVILPNLEACIHRITFHLRRAIGEKVDWPTSQSCTSAPPTRTAQVDLKETMANPVIRKRGSDDV
ncbi:hypothetical protein BKA70DRAFT_1440319 [Coprinopsis sp. MPI-PUGE-AT-0042]|nr:hypothetical protein BKA70DRAFT_1440319 [Coprinopsis sp. MPI-PUGE-AT-0042]